MEFVKAAQPDMASVLNKHLMDCLNKRQSQIKIYFIQLFAQDLALILSQTLLIV